MRRLAILYHHRTQGRGAEGNHIVSIVSAMRAEGHHVDVLSPPGVDPFDAKSTIPVDGAAVKLRGWSAVWKAVSCHLPNALFELAEIIYNVPAYFRLRKAMRRRQYDLLFERYAFYLVAGLAAARRAGCRFALEMNEVSGVADRVRKQQYHRLCSSIERSLLARCDLAHAVSSYLGDRLIEAGLPRERLVVAPNGFDVDRIRLGNNRADMRRRFGFDGCIVVGFAGWFVPWDRLDFLLDVFTEAHAACPNLRLCLVGEGEAARGLLVKLQGSRLEGSVILTGGVPRGTVYDYIQMFDIGILPHSNLFGSPIVMFEMMGLKVPVIAPKLPPIEDVHEDGETALLFTPLNRQQCTRCLLNLAQSPELRNTLAARAYLKLQAEHTWAHTAQRILHTFAGTPYPDPSQQANKPVAPERAP